MFIDTQGQVSCNKAHFDDNHANMFGGAVMLTLGSAMEMEESLLENNRANDEGGALFLSDSKLHVKTTNFRYNAAKSRGGGAILAERGTTIQMESCSMSANAVKDTNGAGGAVVRLDDLSPLTYGKPGYENPYFIAHAKGVSLKES